jgi:multiple sugar transport system substrate-binding protein
VRLRSLLAGVIAAALAVGSAGCGARHESGGVPGSVSLTWWDYFGYSPTADRAITALLDKFHAAYPEIEVRRTTIRFADFGARLDEATAAGTLPDVIAIDNVDVPVLAARNALTDLTPRIHAWHGQTTLLDAVRHSAQVGGKAYGVPFRSNTTALWYNRDLFAEAGLTAPPSTWDELRDHARKLATGGHAGFCFAAAPTEEGTFTLLPLIWQAGGDVATIGDQPSIDALRLIDTLVNEDRTAPPSVYEWGQSDVADQFGAGRCAMMINGPWVLPSVTAGGFDFDVAPWPAGAHGTAAPLGGEVLVIGRNTRHLDTAWHLTTWLADPANSRTEITTGLASIPNRTTTVTDPAWAWHRIVPTFAQQLRTARPRYVYGANYPQISQAITTMQQQVLTRRREPTDAAAETSTKIKPLLSR